MYLFAPWVQHLKNRANDTHFGELTYGLNKINEALCWGSRALTKGQLICKKGSCLHEELEGGVGGRTGRSCFVNLSGPEGAGEQG